MILGCLPKSNPPWKNEDFFPYGNAKEYLILWKQLLSNSLNLFRKGRTSTSRKNGVTGTRYNLHLQQLKLWTKHIFKTLDPRDLVNKWGEPHRCPSLLRGEFPGHRAGKGNPGSIQTPPFVEKMELRFWEGPDSSSLQCIVLEKKELQRKNSRDLQGTPWVFSWVLAESIRKTQLNITLKGTMLSL